MVWEWERIFFPDYKCIFDGAKILSFAEPALPEIILQQILSFWWYQITTSIILKKEIKNGVILSIIYITILSHSEATVWSSKWVMLNQVKSFITAYHAEKIE